MTPRRNTSCDDDGEPEYPRPANDGYPPPQRTRRSWTDDGVHYVTDHASWSGPSASFRASYMSAGVANLDSPLSFAKPGGTQMPRLGESGLIGQAMGLIEKLLLPQSTRATHLLQPGRRDPDHSPLAPEDGGRNDDSHQPRLRNGINGPRDRSPSRPRRGQFSERHFDTEDRQHRPVEQSSGTGGPHINVGKMYAGQTAAGNGKNMDHGRQRGIPDPRQQHQSRSKIPQDLNGSAALETARMKVERTKHEVKRCRRRLERATINSYAPSYELQSLLENLQSQEKAHGQAVEEFERIANRSNAGSGHRGGRHVQEKNGSTSGTARRGEQSFLDAHSAANNVDSPDMHSANAMFNGIKQAIDEHFGFSSTRSTWGGDWAGESVSHLPFIRPDGMNDPAGFFSPHPAFIFGFAESRSSWNSFPAEANTKRGPRVREATGSYTSGSRTTPRSRIFSPPTSALSISEAQQLYAVYKQRWDGLAATDFNIPFPSRGLLAPALTSRSTVWAGPVLQATVQSWSDETVMQANVQAFFLGAVGLKLQFTQALGSGRIEMGFDRNAASSAQLKRLAEIVKQEKSRWHSDRLGRRTGGDPGVNEVLQQDERARAVFHAVCALGEKL